MKFTDVLRKLGIFRSGKVTWSGDAKDRPYAMISNDVYDEEKDLVHAEDVEKAKQVLVDNEHPMHERTGIVATIIRLLLWLIGLLFLVSGMLIMVEQFWAGLFLTCLGVLAIPPLYKKIRAWIGLTRAATVALVILLMFLFLFMLGGSPT
jgi:hypothetical protein